MFQSCTLGNALLKIKVRISNLIYSSEKATEEPNGNGIGNGLLGKKKNTYWKGWLRVYSFREETAKALRNTYYLGWRKETMCIKSKFNKYKNKIYELKLHS